MPEKALIVENGCFDEPRVSDRKREDVFWEEVGEWAKKFTKRPEWSIVYDQNLLLSTQKWCVWYAIYHIYNGNQMNERRNNDLEFTQEDPKNYRYRFQAHRGWKNTWSSLQQHLDFMRNNERSIEWSVICETEDQMKVATDKWAFILTGSYKCDWTKTGKTWLFSLLSSWIWHWFVIVWYDNKWFIAKNSFGAWWGNKWYFTIPFGYKKYLFSCNAVLDSDSRGMLQAYRFERDFQEAIALGITDGSNPEKPATRKEVAVMVVRSLKKALQK